MTTIRTFAETDRDAVVALWDRCGLTRPWNDPHRDIDRKLSVADDLFLVVTVDDNIVAAVMFGFDGHRGWVNYLAVDPAWQRRGIATDLMAYGERELIARGCPKLNLQVRPDNVDAITVYEQMGYQVEEILNLGKRLIPD